MLEGWDKVDKVHLVAPDPDNVRVMAQLPPFATQRHSLGFPGTRSPYRHKVLT